MKHTFLQQDPLEERVLVTEHQAFVGRAAVTLLQVLQRVFMMLDRTLELLDILGTTLAESGLRLAIALFALLRGSVYLTTFC